MADELVSLRQQVAAAKSRLQALQSQHRQFELSPAIRNLSPRSTPQPRPAPSTAAAGLGARTSELEDAREHARRYRLTGWSCWEVELSQGRWAVERADGKAKKGLAIRIETFWRGRFYEPYYVVLTKPKALRATSGLVRAGKGKSKPRKEDVDDEPLVVAHSTIPHFIPLNDLVKDYLSGPDVDIELFLAHLTRLLQAFVSRREQLAAVEQQLSTLLPDSARFSMDSDEGCLGVQMAWLQSDEADERELTVELGVRDLGEDVFGIYTPRHSIWSVPLDQGAQRRRLRDQERRLFERRPAGSRLTGELQALEQAVVELARDTRPRV